MNKKGRASNHLLVTLLMDKVRPGWRERVKKRKSLWNPLCTLIGFALSPVIFYLVFLVIWQIHILIHPEHTGKLANFWRQENSGWAFLPGLLMVLPPAFPSLIGALILGNCLVWLIPAARKVMATEAAGDFDLTFKGANKGLLKALVWTGIVCFLLSVIGAATLTELLPNSERRENYHIHIKGY